MTSKRKAASSLWTVACLCLCCAERPGPLLPRPSAAPARIHYCCLSAYYIHFFNKLVFEICQIFGVWRCDYYSSATQNVITTIPCSAGFEFPDNPLTSLNLKRWSHTSFFFFFLRRVTTMQRHTNGSLSQAYICPQSVSNRKM